MEITFKLKGLQSLTKDIEGMKKKAKNEIYNSMVRGLEFFQSDIIENQMSHPAGLGKSTYEKGLRVQTGNLRRSWKIVKYRNLDIAWLVTRSTYAKIHQDGGKKRPIPKRLFVLEDFETKGRKFITNEIKETIDSMRGKI